MAIDVLILVPKHDEMLAAITAFSLSSSSIGRSANGRRVIAFEVAERSCVLMELNAQTNATASTYTTQAISEYAPRVAILAGTACGWSGRIRYCDVVIADRVVDLQETEEDEKEGTLYRPHTRQINLELAEAVSGYLDSTRRLSADRWLTALHEAYADVDFEIPDVASEPPQIVLATVLSSNRLVRSADIQTEIWKMDGRARALEMEAAGFALACEVATVEPQVHWVVVRGISDFGTKASKPEGVRIAAGLSAAIVVRQLVEFGLRSLFEATVVAESEQSRVPDTIQVASRTFADLAVPFFREKAFTTIPASFFDRGPRFLDTVAALTAQGTDRERALNLVEEARDQFFTGKYREVNFREDIRSVVREWHRDYSEIVEFLGLNIPELDVLYVGVCTGRDLDDVVALARSVTGLDVSQDLLKCATDHRPDLIPVVGAAEEMHSLDTDAFDLYLSLRVYQSALFDIDGAVREARRVLRPNGAFIVSIPDAYVFEEGDGRRSILRGLATAGSDLDPDRPVRLASYVTRAFHRMGFRSLGMLRKRADVYVFGRSPL